MPTRKRSSSHRRPSRRASKRSARRVSRRSARRASRRASKRSARRRGGRRYRMAPQGTPPPKQPETPETAVQDVGFLSDVSPKAEKSSYAAYADYDLKGIVFMMYGNDRIITVQDTNAVGMGEHGLRTNIGPDDIRVPLRGQIPTLTNGKTYILAAFDIDKASRVRRLLRPYGHTAENKLLNLMSLLAATEGVQDIYEYETYLREIGIDSGRPQEQENDGKPSPTRSTTGRMSSSPGNSDEDDL